jgi:ribosome recycling factor
VIRVPIPLQKSAARRCPPRAQKCGGRRNSGTGRRDADDRLKKLLKEHKISEDDERRALEDVQKITDLHVLMIDDIQKKKDQELLGR